MDRQALTQFQKDVFTFIQDNHPADLLLYPCIYKDSPSSVLCVEDDDVIRPLAIIPAEEDLSSIIGEDGLPMFTLSN